MYFARLDGKYDVDVNLRTNQVIVTLNGKEVGRRFYHVEHEPRFGWDALDASEIERLGCEIVDSLPA